MLLSLVACAEKEPPEDTEYVAYSFDELLDGHLLNRNSLGFQYYPSGVGTTCQYDDPDAPRTYEIQINGETITGTYQYSVQGFVRDSAIIHIYDHFSLRADYTLASYQNYDGRKVVPPESGFYSAGYYIPALRELIREISGVNVDDYAISYHYNKEIERDGMITPAYYMFYFRKYVNYSSTNDAVSLCVNLDGTLWKYEVESGFGKMPDELDFNREYIEAAIQKASEGIFADAIEKYDEVMLIYDGTLRYEWAEHGAPYAIISVDVNAYDDGKFVDGTNIVFAVLKDEAPEGYIR